MKNLYINFLILTIAFIPIFISAQSAGDFRSFQTGTWATAANWQTFNGTAWVAAGAAPTSADGVITIQSGHTMTVNATITVDQVVVTSGGALTLTTGTLNFSNVQVNTGATLSTSGGVVTLSQLLIDGTVNLGAAATINQTTVAVGGIFNWNTGIMTVNNPTGGADLVVNGTFVDNSTSAVSFSGGATWQLGANGTYRKQRTGSSVNWANAYEGTMASIPATSNWIIRKTVASNPSFTSVSGTYYGNFIIENMTASTWTMPLASQFSGNTDFPRIKGNFDIGNTTSTANIIFTNTNTNANPLLVMGNMTVRSGNTYNNNGTGTEIQGNLQIDGTIAYDTNDGRQLNFSGGNAQSISGSGTLAIFASTINKGANNLTLNRAITIDNSLTLTQGKIISSNTNLLTIADPASVTVTSPGTNNSFVDGPIRKINTSAGFSFPVGKGSNFQPLLVGTHTGGLSNFWTEDFGTGSCANRGQQVSSYSGTNGAWSLNITALGQNLFYVSSTEAGMGVGGCGDGCLSNGALTNQTLHVANKPNSNCSCFVGCTAGDCGAAYDACGSDFCGGGGVTVEDIRAQSPTINCTGRSNIQMSFIYLENGQGASDNGQVWYFDGVSWAVLADMAKSPTGSCGAQGQWTAFSVNLPASADNNPNVRIGFRWISNADDVGSDPSFAIDDVVLTEGAVDVFTCEYFSGNPVSTFGTAKEVTIDQIVTNEYWILNRDAGTASKQVTLSWDNSSNISDRTSSKVIRWDGAIWRDHANGGTTGVNATDPGCTTQATCGTMTTGLIVSGFSPFTFAVPMSLPITLQRFEVKKEGRKARLEWTTASEENVDYFELMRSTDGGQFEAFGRVAAAGNSSTAKSYAFYDEAPLAGYNYYRFRAVDFDESENFSPVKSLYFESLTNTITVSPNPVKDALHIQFSEAASDVTATLINIHGQQVWEYNNSSTLHNFDMDMNEFPAGIYILRLRMGLVMETVKVVKE